LTGQSAAKRWRRLRDGVCIVTPTKKPKNGKLTEEQKGLNRMFCVVCALVEHPLRLVKQLFGFINLRHRGLKKNTGQTVTLLAPAILWPARGRLRPSMG
jgi:hypothetical protein